MCLPLHNNSNNNNNNKKQENQNYKYKNQPKKYHLIRHNFTLQNIMIKPDLL